MRRSHKPDDVLAALNPGGQGRRRRRARVRRFVASAVRHTTIRWLVAFLVPLAILIFAALGWLKYGLGMVGFIGIGIIGIGLTGGYLVRVEGAHMLWLIPLVAFYLPTYFLSSGVSGVVLANTGHEVTAVLPYDSFQGTDFFHTWQCYVELPGGASVPGPNNGNDPILGCHGHKGQRVKVIVDTRGQIPPVLASERNQWIVPMVSGGGGMLLLLLTVTGAIINGERWIRRNERQLPVGWAESLRRPRGSSAYLWVR